jgi:hypothetical protein
MPSRDPQPIFGLLLPADPIGVEVPLLDLDGGSLTTREATGALFGLEGQSTRNGSVDRPGTFVSPPAALSQAKALSLRPGCTLLRMKLDRGGGFLLSLLPFWVRETYTSRVIAVEPTNFVEPQRSA